MTIWDFDIFCHKRAETICEHSYYNLTQKDICNLTFITNIYNSVQISFSIIILASKNSYSQLQPKNWILWSFTSCDRWHKRALCTGSLCHQTQGPPMEKRDNWFHFCRCHPSIDENVMWHLFLSHSSWIIYTKINDLRCYYYYY